MEVILIILVVGYIIFIVVGLLRRKYKRDHPILPCVTPDSKVSQEYIPSTIEYKVAPTLTKEERAEQRKVNDDFIKDSVREFKKRS